jgi:hypothetical protein
MDRKIIKAAIDTIIANRRAQVPDKGGIIDIPINGGGKDLLLKPGLTNEQIFGDLFPTLYAAGNADPIGKIISIVNEQAKLLGYDPNNLTKPEVNRLAAAVIPKVEAYINSFGDLLRYFNI